MGYSNPTEFQECWENMVDEFKLKRNQAYYKWFEKLYNLRDKWCTALSKNFFSTGILSSQQSESTNNAIEFKAKKSTSLYQFFKKLLKDGEKGRQHQSFTAQQQPQRLHLDLLVYYDMRQRCTQQHYLETLNKSSRWLSHLQLNRLSTWEIKRCTCIFL